MAITNGYATLAEIKAYLSISDTFMKASALEGLKEIAILPGGPQQILQVPGVRQVLLALGTTEAKDVLEALEPPK